MREALKIDAGKWEIALTFGAIPRNSREIAMLSRSMVEILLELGAGAEVPERHVEEGRTMPNLERASGSHPREAPLVRIRSSAERPEAAFTAMRYRDRWFWIDDRDYRSKGIFTFLMLLFSLSETGVTAQAPVITIPGN